MKIALATASLAVLALSSIAAAQDSASETPEPGAYPGKVYSPYAARAFPTRPLWGDSHVHTALSMDAGLFGNRLGPEEAHRFARGEDVVSSTGQPVKLTRPLDWILVSDHSDGLGMVQDVMAGAPEIMRSEQGRRWFAGMREGGQAGVKAALDLITTFSQAKMDPEMFGHYSPGSNKYKSIWQRAVDAAEKYNEPGRFTALLGFEWTSLVKGANMHRNVIFRDGPVQAKRIVPYTTQAPVGSPDPLDLYDWMASYEEKTGGSVLALAHNGNLSNGIMFPIDAQYSGRKLDKRYVEQRAKWEPLYEVTQIKGDSETHPKLSPDDGFADFEAWDVGNLDLSVAKTDAMLAGEYAREALKNGLALEERLGTNPYKFGMVGSTDSHTSLATAGEDNFFGKHSGYEPSPERMSHPFMKTDQGVLYSWQQSASGLAAVWAKENTRESIFDAMARKEVYATTGPRMTVRLFGGWDFVAADLSSRQPAFVGYAKGVPMGGDLRAHDGDGAPSFMVYALRDPEGANLDRIQIIKGWLDGEGRTHERVYDVSVSAGREITDGNCATQVGNTVDIERASWTNTIGASELATVWTDPEFDPAERAFYYARVIEIPTPRWVVYDAYRFGVEIPEGATTVLQELAYTSPIWFTPAK